MISGPSNHQSHLVVNEQEPLSFINNDNSVNNFISNVHDSKPSCIEEAQEEYDRIHSELQNILQQLEKQASETRHFVNNSNPLASSADPTTSSTPPSSDPPSPDLNTYSPDLSQPNTQVQSSDDKSQSPLTTFIPKKKINFKAMAKNVTKKIKKNKKYNYPSAKDNLFIPHGDIITEDKNDHHTRIILQNPCGITSENNAKLEDVVTQFQAYKADYLGLPESRVNPYSDFAHTSQTIIERRIPGGSITHTNTHQQIPSSSAFQYGGITTIMSKSMNKILKTTNYDKYGRWIKQSFFIHKKLLHIYTVYRVCDSGEEHEQSASEAQKHQLELNSIDLPPRKHVVQALRTALEKDLETKSEIIVLADANESRLHTDTLFMDMMREIGFSNVMEERLGLQIPPTQDRGKEAIDHAWISQGLQEALVAAGILPLFDFILSDHRSLVLDFSNHKLHSKSKFTLNHYTTQKISSKNIKSRDDYLEKISQQLVKQRFHSAISTFRENKEKLTRDEQIKFLDTRVKQLYEIMLGSENRCKHKYDGFFTPELSLLWSTKHHIEKRIRTLKWQEIHKPRLFDLDELLELQPNLSNIINRIDELNLTAEETENKLDDLLATDWVQQKKFDTHETALKVIKNMRKQKKDSAKIKAVVHRNERQDLSHITIPSASEYSDQDKPHYKNTDVIWNRIEIEQGEDIKDWEPVTLQSEVESILHKWQHHHFQQANTTPLGNKEWIDRIDGANSLNDIKEEAESLNPSTQKLLERIFPIEDAEETTYSITIDDFKTFIDSKDEKTRTSPNGIHYGHLKSVRDHVILEYIFYLIELTIELNHIPKLWRDTITILAPKKSGVYHIHRLRPLHIVEPMVQFISHIFWSNKFMKECEAKVNITDSQYGGRRGRQAQNAVIKQVVLWDIARHQNKLMASHMADARANFDRNMSHIVARALIVKGFDPRIVNLYQTFLRSQLFYIRTAFGISDKPYKYDPNNPFFGDGQGIGWSSVNQIIISTIIDEIFTDLATEFKVTSADHVFKILTGVNFFIDDRFSNTINHEGNIQQLLKDFQHNETLQTNLLNDTGGAVAPKKCSWWMLERKPKDMGFGIRIKPSVDGELHLKNTGDPLPYKIRRLPPNVAKKYLGCLIAPDFSSNVQFQVLKDAIVKWCAKIRHSQLPPHLISKSYNENLVPKLSYPLVVADISKSQAERLMRIIRTTISLKTRYRRTTALEVTHGPFELLGEQITHIYDLSGREKVAFFMYHVRNSLNKDDTVYDVIMTSFLDHQLALGFTGNFLNLNYKKWGKIIPNRSWLIALWDYISTHDTQVDMNRFFKYQPPRENDFFLMEEILEQERDLDNILIFNKVRMHFEILTASDIINEDGKTFHPDVFHHQQLHSINSSLNWPNKEELPNEWFNIFRQMLNTHIRYRINRKNLGAWEQTTHQVHSAQLVDKDTLWMNGHTYHRIRGNRFKRLSDEEYEAPEIRKTVRTAVESQDSILLIDKKAHRVAPVEDTIEDWRQDLWGITGISEEELDKLAELLRQPFILVTDGGCPDHLNCSIFSWVLSDTQGNVFFKSGGGVGGFSRDHTSFRAEAYACLSGVSFINYMHNRYDGLSLHREFYCDNLEVTKLTPSLYVNPKRRAATKRNFDVKTQLEHELACHVFPPNIQHVLGHQDKYKPWIDLTIPEQLNCITDGFGHEVEEYFYDHPEKLPPDVSTFLPAQEISLRTPLHRLVMSSPNEVCFDSRNIKLLDYMQRRQHFTQEQIDCWDFDSFQGFCKNLSRSERSNYRNILYRQWSTMERLHKLKIMESPLCPLCKMFDETEEHVLSCMCSKALPVRQAAIATAKHAMREIRTPEKLIDVFAKCLRTGALVGPDFDDYRDDFPELETLINKAITDQETIGLEKLQSGLLARSWKPLLTAHIKLLHDDRFRAAAWMKKMIRICFEYTSSIWLSRCSAAHNDEEPLETTYRTNMINLYNSLQNDPSVLGTCKSLLHRSVQYFQTKPIDDIKLWEAKVRAAKARKIEWDKKARKKTLHRHFPTKQKRKPTQSKSTRKRRVFESRYRRRKRRLKELNSVIRRSNIRSYLILMTRPSARPDPPIDPPPEPPDPDPDI